jgi:potassium efflux system protein
MGIGYGQPPEATTPPPATATKPQETRITPEQMQIKISQLEQDKSLDPEVQKKAVELWKEALATTNLALQQDTRIQRLIQQREEAPKLRTAIQEQLAAPVVEPMLTIAKDASISDYDQGLARAQSQFAELSKAAEDFETRLKDRADRRARTDKSAAQATADLEKMAAETDPAADEHAEVTRGKRVVATARRTLLGKQLQAAQEELAGFDLITSLLTDQRDQAVRQQTQAETMVALWKDAVSARRQQEAELAAQKAQEAARQAAQSYPAIKAIADENKTLAEMRTGPDGLMRKAEAAAAHLKTVTAQLDRIKGDFTRVRDRATSTGGQATAGMILLNKRSILPNLGPLKKSIDARQSEIADIHFLWIDKQDTRSKLADPEKSVKAIIADLDKEIGSEQLRQIENEVRTLLRSQAGYLDALLREYEGYLANLSALDQAERQLVDTTEQFSKYIDERILWVKSAPVLNLAAFERAVEAVRWYVNPANWNATGEALVAGIVHQPTTTGMMAVVWGLLIWYRKRIRRQIQEEAGQATGRSIIVQTLRSLWQVGLMAVSRPYWLWMLYRILADSPVNNFFADSVAAGLLRAAKAYFILEFIRGLLLPGSLEMGNRGWSSEARLFVRRNLRWLTFVILITHFLQTAIDTQNNDLWKDSLGRIAFMVRTLTMAVFFVIILAPKGALIRPYLGLGMKGWLGRLRFLWYSAAILLPGSLAVIAGLGYFYTAEQLYWRVIGTILLCVGAVEIGQILSVWLAAARKTLTDQELRQRQQEQAQASADARTRSMSALLSVAVPFETIYRVSQQSKRIVQAFFLLGIVMGLWAIWKDVLPALGVMDQVVLWETTVKAGETTDAAGKVIQQTRTAPVTLSNLVAALVTLAMMIITARNLPGLLQIAVLQQVGMDRGIQFAITTLSRYAIVVVGLVMAFNQIGINWSKVQWLVAAMTVGLAFGLQEIFANFVSGLIILFERPMRVGDIVTSGEITGKVSQIQIRATTIQTWDNKELVVPNKEFVTGRLMNWTLTDPQLRISFLVGVAYGSDTAQVEQALYAVARQHPDVLKDPEPTVAFMNFGASSLDFDLRLSIPNLDVLMKVRHEINTAIDQAFRKANIEIPFPQQDLHVRTIAAGLPVEMRKTN